MDYLKLAIYMIDFKIILFFSLTILAITCVLYFLIFIPFGIDPFNSEVKNKKLSDYNRNQILVRLFACIYLSLFIGLSSFSINFLYSLELKEYKLLNEAKGISISEYIAVNRTHKDKTKEQIKILELELLANKYNLIFER